jgi:putative FmdB family regulatory protein
MPILEFECVDCGKKAEFIVVCSDMILDGVCEHCGGKLEKIISSPNFNIKGHSMKDKYGLASNHEYVKDAHRRLGKEVKTNYFE